MPILPFEVFLLISILMMFALSDGLLSIKSRLPLKTVDKNGFIVRKIR